MKKTLYILLSVLTALIGLAFIIPLFINFNTYKPMIQEKVLSYTGQKLDIQGPIRLGFLPTPHISLEKISLKNSPSAQTENILSVEQIEVRISLIPLLRGNVEIEKIYISQPEIHLEILPNGRGNWEIKMPQGDLSTPDSEASSQTAKKDSSPLKLNDLRISNAHVYYHSGKELYHVDRMNAHFRMPNHETAHAEGQFFVQEKPLNFTFQIESLFKDPKVETQIKFIQSHLTIQGTYKDEIFHGQTAGSLDLKEILSPLGISYSHFSPASDSPLTFSSQFTATPSVININDLKLNKGPLTSKGKGIFHLHPFKATFNLSIDQGDTSFDLDLATFGEKITSTLQYQTKNNELFLTSLGFNVERFSHPAVDLNAFKKHLLKSTTCLIAIEKNSDTLNLTQAQCNFPHTTIKSTFSIPLTNMHPLRYETKITSLKPMFDIFRIHNGPGETPFSLKGNSRIHQQGFPSELNFTLTGLNGSLKGNLFPFHAHVHLQHPHLKSFLQTFDLKASTDVNIQQVAFESLIQHHLNKISLSKMNSKIGFENHVLHLKGALTVDQGEALPSITGKIDLENLILKTLPPQASSQSSALKKHPHRASEKSPKTPTSLTPWSKEKIDFSALKKFNLDLKITCPHLQYQDWIVQNFKITTVIKNGNLEIPSITGQIFGGEIQGHALFDPKNITLNLIAKNAQLKRLPLQSSQFKVLKGNADMKIDLTSKGQSTYEVVSNLKGLTTFNVIKGVIQGFDLDALVHLLGRLNGVEILTSITKLLEGGETRFSELNARLTFSQGVGTLSQFDLKAKGAETKAQGQIHLPQYTLDTLWQIKFPTQPDFPAIKMRLFGSLNDIKKEININDLRNYLVNNVFQSLLKGGNPLKNLLGGNPQEEPGKKRSSDTQKESPSASPLEKVIEKPEEAIKDILKNLF